MNVSVSIDWLIENQAKIERLQQENEELRRQVQQAQLQQQQPSRNDWRYYNMRNGTRVRHTTARGHLWEGIYHVINNVVECNGNEYISPSQFARQHNVDHAQYRVPNDDGKGCTIMRNGQWTKLRDFP